MKPTSAAVPVARAEVHDQPGVGAEVVDAIGDRLAQFVILEVVHPHGGRLARGMPLLPGILEVPHQLLLLGVHRDHGLTALLELLGAPRNVLELRVAVWMPCPFRVLRLTCRL